MADVPVPTRAELAILRALWDIGPATVRQLHNALKEARGTGYSTTLKLIQVMTEKGLVQRDASRPQRYWATLAEEHTQTQLVDDLIQRGFRGSAMKLVVSALSAKRVSKGELAEIRKLIEEAKGARS
jgi:BlaI family transcriptional regulator, penicillinase repressor